MRRFHILKINEHNKNEQKEQEEAQNKIKSNKNNSIQKPNINPSSTYNF